MKRDEDRKNLENELRYNNKRKSVINISAGCVLRTGTGGLNKGSTVSEARDDAVKNPIRTLGEFGM